jgi:hypothetical protein
MCKFYQKKENGVCVPDPDFFFMVAIGLFISIPFIYVINKSKL